MDINERQELLNLIESLQFIFSKAENINKKIIQDRGKETVFTYVAITVENAIRLITEYYYGNREIFTNKLDQEKLLKDYLLFINEQKKEIRDFIHKIEIGEQNDTL